MARRIIRLRAYLDAVEFADFIARNNYSASLRFLDAFDETCRKLFDMAGLGSPWESEYATRLGLSFWPIEGFPNHLIFFRRTEDRTDILRVFHASRDFENLVESL